MALVAAGMVLVAAAAFGQTDEAVLAPTVFASHALPSDAVTGFTVSCPAGYAAVSGGVSSPGAGSTLLSIRPVGLRGFTFRFGNPATNDATRVTVAVACRTIRGGPLLRLRPVTARAVVKPGTQQSGLLACPAGSTPAGAVADLDPGRAKSVDSFAGPSLGLRAATATPRAFQFRIANTGKRARHAVVRGNCVTVALAPHVQRAQLSTKVTTYTNVISPGRHHFKHHCRRGWISLGTGFALTSGSLRLDGTAAIGAIGHAWVVNTGRTRLTAQLQVVCARVD
jgi:hypothetical protein